MADPESEMLDKVAYVLHSLVGSARAALPLSRMAASRVLFRLLIMHRWLLVVGLSSPFGMLACDVSGIYNLFSPTGLYLGFYENSLLFGIHGLHVFLIWASGLRLWVRIWAHIASHNSPSDGRGRPSSPAPPPGNDDLLSEILLRLPPAPSSLPRASLVCKHWRRLVTNPAFLRRFRARHRRGAPLLGFFAEGLRGHLFTSTLEPPNRVPRGCFSLQLDDVYEWRILSCRHGLVLLHHWEQLQVLVWDPVTGYQRRIAVPPGFRTSEWTIINNGVVFRAAGDVHGGNQSSTFQVVLLGSNQEFTRAFACVCSSENGEWRDPISIACPGTCVTYIPGTFLGSSLTGILLGIQLLSLSSIWTGSA
ncbi:uncharacterized protein LOC120652924 [Panicum virgatum]|uniref:uncharacterized protein LOC120652924 n=1 Tax=Panicum virgatum TaxID=38727 RepID=UPI0019D67F20|nr:uncharacterized protein LOC120652924 [Panicum virgatum]